MPYFTSIEYKLNLKELKMKELFNSFKVYSRIFSFGSFYSEIKNTTHYFFESCNWLITNVIIFCILDLFAHILYSSPLCGGKIYIVIYEIETILYILVIFDFLWNMLGPA